MYRGHILAEWENIFDIADIDGNRRGGQDFFYPLSDARTSVPNFDIAFTRPKVKQNATIQHDQKDRQKYA
jgi:hypothetical protein